jgi:hypothetical protein
MRESFLSVAGANAGSGLQAACHTNS